MQGVTFSLSALIAQIRARDSRCPVTDLGQRLLQFVTRVSAIRQHMTQPREAISDVFENHKCAVPVLYIGAVDGGMDPKAIRIGDDMAFATLHSLPRIIASHTAAFGCFGRLAVDDTGAGRAFAALSYTRILDQIMVDTVLRSIVAPSIKPAL
jgi:hypothetical protein